MKTRLLILSGILFLAGNFLTNNFLAAQTPQKVDRWVNTRMTHEWYAEQAGLWKKETEKNPKNGEAWMNYYRAQRYANFGDTGSTHEEKQARIKEILAGLEKHLPDSYEFHYTTWWNGGNDITLSSHLERAFEMRPDYAEMSRDFLSYYELQGKRDKVQFFAQKWYETHEMAPALLEYNYNVLMSLDKNAVLFTCGDNDTYPIWLLQAAKKIRPDVRVLNISLMGVPDYNEGVLKEEKLKGDSKLIAWQRFATTPYEQCVGEFLKSFCESNPQRPIYFGLTVEPYLLETVKENLYLTGLANKYSTKRIDNVALLRKNWENFRLDYLDNDFYTENYGFNTSLLPQLNMNYVTPALVLYEHYMVSGEKDKAERMKEFAERIAQTNECEEEVSKYVKNLQTEENSSGNDRSAQLDGSQALDHQTDIYPNPAEDFLSIILPASIESTVDILDLKGDTILSTRENGKSIRLSIANIATGSYFVRITTAEGSFTRKIQITR